MSNIEYNVKSEHAAEFIHDGEIRDTLAWAHEHRNDRALIEEILAKASLTVRQRYLSRLRTRSMRSAYSLSRAASRSRFMAIA